MVILKVCENVLKKRTGKVLGWWEGFHLLKKLPRGCLSRILHHRTTARHDFSRYLRDVIQYPHICFGLFLFGVGFFAFLFQTAQSKTEKLPICIH